MIQPFSIQSPTQIFFGRGELERIPDILGQERLREGAILLLTDRGVSASGIPQGVALKIEAKSMPVVRVDSVPQEPYSDEVDSLAQDLRNKKIGCIVGIGGGSVMDTAKILSILLSYPEQTTETLLEKGVPGKGLPTLLVPTTAGTGSEATPVAIVAVKKKRLKIGVVSPFLISRYVVLDPMATLGLPPALTASTGIDALCHLLECYTSKKANPYSDLLALEGIRLIFSSLKTAFDNGQDIEARSNMLLASFYGGLCIASSSTTGVHALSYPLGGMYRIPHGVANAMLLAPIMEFNQDAIPEKMERAAKAAGIDGEGRDLVPAFIRSLGDLVRYVGIPPRLSAFGIEKKDIPELTSRAMEVTRLLSNNPKPISREEAAAIYERIL